MPKEGIHPKYANIHVKCACGNAAARQADMAQVDSWTQRAMGARKTNELNKEKKLGGGVTM